MKITPQKNPIMYESLNLHEGLIPQAFLFRILEPAMIFEKTIRDTDRPQLGTTQTPGLPLASATAKAVPAAVPVGLVKVQNGGRRISSERESCIQLGHQLVVLKVQPIFWLILTGSERLFLGFFCHPIEFVIPQEELKHPTRVVHESSFWLRSCLKRKISWDMSHRIVSNKEGHWKIHQR